ncbi:MAG: hypothetical protein SPE88_02800 [Paludibacteraceae bacterium]|nr:hypothetical protein [Paludibacteraceae bacterium]
MCVFSYSVVYPLVLRECIFRPVSPFSLQGLSPRKDCLTEHTR